MLTHTLVVLFVYECLITFGDEVALFWTRRFTGATVLFVSNRALVMWAHVFTMITSYIPISAQVKSLSPVVLLSCRLTDDMSGVSS